MTNIVDQALDRLEELQSTPEGRAKLGPRALQWLGERQEREGAQQAAAMDILAVCKKHFPKDNANLEAPEMLAEAISYFDLSDNSNNGCPLYLEWTVGSFVGQKLLDNIDNMLTIYNTLVEHGCTEDTAHDWNDGDNKLFYIPVDGKRVWCAISQNTRYVFIMDWNETLGVTDIHVRRYWDAVKPAIDGSWEMKDRAKYNEHGFERAVRDADWLKERWSDNIWDNLSVDRPDLQWWKDCDFKPQYGDCRDSGYVMSLNVSLGGRARVDRAIYFMSDIKTAFLEIRWACLTIKDF